MKYRPLTGAIPCKLYEIHIPLQGQPCKLCEIHNPYRDNPVKYNEISYLLQVTTL